MASRNDSTVQPGADPVETFDLRLAHVGINAESDADVDRIVGLFSSLMAIPTVDHSPISRFAGDFVEVMRPGSAHGTNGHIGFHVNDVDAAAAWFASRGFEVDPDSRRVADDGSTMLVYFKEEIGGFAIHLTAQ